jgi:hypothetical protein
MFLAYFILNPLNSLGLVYRACWLIYFIVNKLKSQKDITVKHEEELLDFKVI